MTRSLRTLVIGIIVAGLAGVGWAAEETPLLSFGHPPHFTSYHYLYGLMAGKVGPQGVRLDFKAMWSGQINNLLVAGKLDAGVMSISAYVIGRAKGFPYVAIGSAITERGSNSIWVPARSAVRTPKKVTWITKELPILVALMEKGELDAAILWGDFYYKSLNDPRFRLLFQIGPEIKQMLGVYPVVQLTVVQERLVRERPQAVRAFLQALRASRDYVKTASLDEVIDFYIKRRGEGDRQVLVLDAKMGSSMDFTFTPEERRYFETYTGWAKEFGLVEKKLALKDLVLELD
ncbi:MAG: ABC transporter substrate-binding protein [Deltaproteobacteria bacterium]|nr:ABC transporter substrate-binding protein [Deltaproteobacteria bacterium]